jgi:hypothetical protein
VNQQIRERMNKWYYVKLKGFCTKKEMVSKLKRPPTEWEEIFVRNTQEYIGSSKNQTPPKSMNQ